MYALVDCNSFFCSVEKVFHPGLGGKPVCVLSSNDGCIIALTPEAKALGLRRGDPFFKVKDILDRFKVAVFSTNMQLYAAMSRRVTDILRKSIYHVENYSIDESFCDLNGYGQYFDMENLMRDTADKIRTWTDIPVSVGIAPSKTLAKIGSKFAKKYPAYRSVCMIDTDEKRRKALQLTELGDIWGIGRGTLAKLEYYGVHTPLEFADKSESWVRAHFTKPGMATWKELNGIPCIDTAEALRKQTICTSRSFGKMVKDLKDLREAVISFASACANKLRAQRSVAGSVTVFLSSNRFREDLEQYGDARTACLQVKTSDTLEICHAALGLVETMFVQGILYKKAGVIVGDIGSDRHVCQYLFDEVRNRPQRNSLMKVIDGLNHRFGVKTVHIAAEGEGKRPWNVKSSYKSRNYLTDINELLTINI